MEELFFFVGCSSPVLDPQAGHMDPAGAAACCDNDLSFYGLGSDYFPAVFRQSGHNVGVSFALAFESGPALEIAV